MMPGEVSAFFCSTWDRVPENLPGTPMGRRPRLIPYESLSGRMGVLPGFRPDNFVIYESGGQRVRKDAIIGEIRRYLRDNNPIRVSRSLRDVAYESLQIRDTLISRLDREPNVKEISKELKTPEDEVVHALDAIQERISPFEPVYHGGLRSNVSR